MVKVINLTYSRNQVGATVSDINELVSLQTNQTRNIRKTKKHKEVQNNVQEDEEWEQLPGHVKPPGLGVLMALFVGAAFKEEYDGHVLPFSDGV